MEFELFSLLMALGFLAFNTYFTFTMSLALGFWL
jgi:hypothetical protein